MQKVQNVEVGRLGATVEPDGTRFTVWAPSASQVEVSLAEQDIQMRQTADGYYDIVVEGVEPGDRYGFKLDGGPVLPDPASRSQPDGVHARSEVTDRTLAQIPPKWKGVELDDLVLYELHVGTFSTEGTFDSAIPYLAQLADLGVSAIEIMPIAQFPGGRNWGYDGVYAFAAQDSYGGRAGLRRLVEAAHEAGLAVILDVVHNHIGPEGNYLASFGPYFNERVSTGWGDAMNMTEPGSDAVRRYFIDSAVEWITDFGIDGLRLDAVHAIIDQTANPYLEQLVDAVNVAASSQGRNAIVIAESSDNDPKFIAPPSVGGIGCDAVWNDDLHHGIRVALTNERPGYYADYQGIDDIVRCFELGWVFTGQYSVARGRRHGRALAGRVGRPDRAIPFNQLVVCDQNHDQIGNRAAGDRLDVNVTTDQRRLAAATTVLGPFTPMLFMGEEYGETAPFPFFVSHTDPDLLEAVRRGRAAEFPQNDQKSVPDPAATATFESAKLDRRIAETPNGAATAALYKQMLATRRLHPVLTSTDADHFVSEHDGVITIDRRLNNARSHFVMNYSNVENIVFLDDEWSVAVSTHTDGPLERTVDGWPLGAWCAALFLSHGSEE